LIYAHLRDVEGLVPPAPLKPEAPRVAPLEYVQQSGHHSLGHQTIKLRQGKRASGHRYHNTRLSLWIFLITSRDNLTV